MRRGAMRLMIAALMIGVLTMWVEPLGAQEAEPPPKENFTSNPMLCTPVLTAILLGGVVTTDVVILNNPSVSAAVVTATWFAADGTNNATTFNMPGRTFRVTTPADVVFTAAGVYAVRVQAGGNLAILASIQRLHNNALAGVFGCYFLG